jgi:hypothetical protein
LAFCLLPETFKEKVKLDTWPLFARAWLRSFIFANLIYLGLGLTWAYYIYNVYGFYLFPKGKTTIGREECPANFLSVFLPNEQQQQLTALPPFFFLPKTFCCVFDNNLQETCQRLKTLLSKSKSP